MARESHLPTEILDMIFKLATRAVTVDTSYQPLSCDVWQFESSFPSAPSWHRSELATHKCLTLVSRRWRELSLPLLYHHISLFHELALSSLVGTVEASHNELGALIRRIDLLFSEESGFQNNDVPILRLLQSCPNLTVLFQSLPKSIGSSPGKLTCNPPMMMLGTAQKLLLQASLIGTCASDMTAILSFLQVQRELRILNLSLFLDGDCGVSALDVLSLPKLHTIRLDSTSHFSVGSVAKAWDVPSLRRIQGPWDYKEWSKYINPHQITSVYVEHALRWDDFLCVCPNIEEVYLNHQPPIWISTQNKIVRIGLELKQQDEWAIKDHLITFKNPTIYPNLSVIRLSIQKPMFKTKRQGVFWAYWASRWEAADVRLEYKNGHSIFQDIPDKFRTEDVVNQYLKLFK
ncbi:uncharacterized protein EI90DRAFT_3032763 [Cantharellus anzutake]|uniref:uncharacterized protein n=1 Tax=Cantharellus anzutake TaxID=1750568 RepID=UPI0019088CDB|nr:uncharacterized protein EI90DRAFT_3032763 [Cantharellus anzutake]KAF8342283.1 hypothetical protein EI90DRAFT_3032763 [Cantharellus anzutake]